MTSSVAALRAAGITIEADEAVAIAQQLISSFLERRDADEVEPPYGPPSLDNVILKDDGAVVCVGCTTTPAVSEVGIFLDAMLPTGAGRVPGGVRYTIARALLDVDVPPYDSLADLSRALERHEHGRRAGLVRGVLARAGGAQTPQKIAIVERRQGRASASELRRSLREADARWFEHQRQLPRDHVIDLRPPTAAAPKRDFSPTAVAACLAAGLSLIGTGEVIHRRQAAMDAARSAPIVMHAPAADVPRAEPAAAVVTPERGIIVVRDNSSSRPRPLRRDVRRVSIKRTAARPAAMMVRRPPASRPPSRSLLDRLKLGWLRAAFAAHSDL